MPRRKPEAPDRNERGENKPSQKDKAPEKDQKTCSKIQAAIQKTEGELRALKHAHTKHRKEIAFLEVQLDNSEVKLREARGRKMISHAPSLALSLSDSDASETGKIFELLSTNMKILNEPEIIITRKNALETKQKLNNLYSKQKVIERGISQKEKELYNYRIFANHICD